MPSTSYFVTAQIVLVIASAAVVKTDWKKPSQPAVPPLPDPPAALPLDSSLVQKARQMPGGEIERFAALEQASHDLNAKAAEDAGRRAMGAQRSSEMERRAADFFTAETLAAAEAVVSDTPPAPEFAPVPGDAGYHIEAESATNFDLKTNSVVFSGEVGLKCKDFHMSASRLLVRMAGDSKSLKHLIANGNVKIHLLSDTKEGAYRGSSEQAVYDPALNSIVLTGWPKIIGEGREHIASTAGTRMTLHTKPSKLVTEGRAMTRVAFDGKNGMPGLTMGPPPSASPPGKN